MPEIQVGENALAEFAFGADSEQPVTDELLNPAQYQFCVYAEQNGKLDTLPEEAILLYAPTAQYRMQFGDETVFMQLSWDNELKMYRLGYNSQYRTPIFTLMKLLGMEPSWSASEDRFHIESGEDDAEREPELVVDGEMRYGISEIRYKGERYAGTRSFGYEPTEADLREILHIRLEVDPLTKTSTIYQE